MRFPILLALILVHVQLTPAQSTQDIHFVFGGGITGIGGDESIPIGFVMTYGMLRGDFGFVNSIGYSENDAVPMIRSATFTIHPVFRVSDNFLVGVGPQLKTTLLGLMGVSYVVSGNLQIGDQFMFSLNYSRFDKLGATIQVLF
jgi:hypothetical protein